MKKSRFEEISEATKLNLPKKTQLEITGEDPIISTPFPVGEVAAFALGLTGIAAEELWFQRRGVHQKIRVDVRDASATLLGFGFQKFDIERKFTLKCNPTVGLYKTADKRWIHLHGGFPNLAKGLLETLECKENPDQRCIKSAVKNWNGEDLEESIAEHSSCGVLVRSIDEWSAHPQGLALANIPVVEISRIGDGPPQPLSDGESALDGIRVMDLTRVLAGPACGRTLASYGADVMRIGSPKLPSFEPFVIETGHGKRSVFVDLNTDEGVICLENLISKTDIFTQGYRTGTLEDRGFGSEKLAKTHPGIIYVSINCYGHVGPWVNRKGWEQLAQCATGIAHAQSTNNKKPQLIPAAPTDYTTGYLAAYGVMNALSRRAKDGGSWHVRASLCQTGMWLTRLGATLDTTSISGMGDITEIQEESDTQWGRLTHLKPVVQMSETPPKWSRPPVPLGTHVPEW